MNDKYILDSNALTAFSRKLSIQNIKLHQIWNHWYGFTNFNLRLHSGLSSDKIAGGDKFLQLYQDYV